MTDGRQQIERAEDTAWSAMGRYVAAVLEGQESPDRLAELKAEAEAADDHLTGTQDSHPLAWSDLEAERDAETEHDAMYGTAAEQAADAVVTEAGAIVSEAEAG